jgi:hypothetical protein
MIASRSMTSPWFRALAFAAALLIAAVPMVAAAPPGPGTVHHLVQVDGDVITAATPAGKAMRCCPPGTGQTGDIGCSDLLCASAPPTLASSPQVAVAGRALREAFPELPGVLSPHYVIPAHGPPRA